MRSFHPKITSPHIISEAWNIFVMGRVALKMIPWKPILVAMIVYEGKRWSVRAVCPEGIR